MKIQYIASSLLCAVMTFSIPAFGAHPGAAADYQDPASKSFLFFGKKNKKKKSSTDESKDSVEKKHSYQELIGDSAVIDKGMFDVITKGDDYYFEIPVSLLGRDMLIVNKMVRVPKELNDAGVNRGINYSNQMIKFEWDKKANKLFVRESRPLPNIPAEAALARSVKDNYISPIIASFKIETLNPDSTSLVIKVNDVYDGSSTSFNDVFFDINIGTSPNKDLSRILKIKSFDNNIYAVSELTTKVVEPGGTVFVTVEVGSTLLLLPETPMPRRYVSPRVGYFTESFLNYSDRQARVTHPHYITRWRLEPKPEDVEDYLAGKIVEPVKPIVFYIDNSTPKQWRPYIKQGIEEWQRAFEMAGFKNAIIARELPEDDNVDLDDINYSVVNYAASTKSNAMGPSITDPRSGEILEADIMWWHNVLDILHDWIIVQTGAVNPDARTNKLPDHLVGDAMRFVACHEVGHSLGLRHNMMASSAIPTDSLRSEKFTTMLNSTSASIMDYARFNYVAQPGDGVKVLSPNLGPYDMLAIEYGYRWYGKDTPEEEYAMLQQLLSNYDTPMYAYSESQDSREANDPRAQSEDLGDNSVKSSMYGVANLKRIMPNLINWTTTGEVGQDYDDASQLYNAVIWQWNRYMYHVLANVGGIYVDNTTVGDGRHTYRYVEKDRQREAVKFLIDEVFLNTDWLFDADITNYTYIIKNTPIGRIEQAPSVLLKNAQSYLLWDLLSDNRIVRMLENEANEGNKAFSAIEMTDMLHKAVFNNTRKGVKLGVRERSMQKNYVDALIIAACERQGLKDGVPLGLLDERMINIDSYPSQSHNHSKCGLGEHTGTPRQLNFYGSQANRVSDAVSIKRGELMRVRNLLINSRGIADRATRYHYDDMLMRINTALGLPQQ